MKPKLTSSSKKSPAVRPLLYVMPFLKDCRSMLVAATVSLLLAAGVTLTIPLLVRHLVDSDFFSTGVTIMGQGYLWLSLLLVIALAVTSALRFYCVSYIGEKIVANMRASVYSHILTLSPSFFEENPTGDLLSRLAADTLLIKNVLGSGASVALRNVILLMGSFVMLVVTSPVLSGAVFITLAVVVIPLIFMGRRVRQSSRHSQDTTAQVMREASQTFSAITTVQSYTYEAASRAYFSRKTDHAFRAAKHRITLRALLTAFAIFFAFFCVLGIFVLGGYYVAQGYISPGLLGQFILYGLFAAGSLSALSEIWGEVQLAAGATERLAEIMQEKPSVGTRRPKARLPKMAPYDVVFDNVFFQYPSQKNAWALESFSLTIKAGETVALVGASGAGKSSVFALLQRFYDFQKGRVLVGGVNAQYMEPQHIRQNMALVSQEPFLFTMTVADNICFGQQGKVSKKAVEDAAKNAMAHDFICQLPQGYATIMGERGVTLSGGQRQRLVLARAFLRNAPVLLLDEATNALDGQNEQAVQESIKKLSANKTTLIISHRLSIIHQVDKIVVMDKGRVVMVGSHGQLMQSCSIYQNLVKSQFQKA